MFKKRRFWPKKSNWYRGARKAVLPARVIPKSIARVRTDWVTVYNPFGSPDCTWVTAPYTPIGDGSCISSFNFQVMGNDQLSETYQDDVKIVAMRGNLWLRPAFVNADRCDAAAFDAWLSAHSDYFFRARGGLYKQRVVGTPGFPQGLVPHPMQPLDWSDAGWLSMRERTWTTHVEGTQTVWNDQQFLGPFGKVSRAQYTVPPTADGDQPTYNVPAISTTCDDCFPDEGECLFGGFTQRYVSPGWKVMSWNHRRTIHMHEEDRLDWFFDWSFLGPAATQPDCEVFGPYAAPCQMQLVPELKIKVQYG